MEGAESSTDSADFQRFAREFCRHLGLKPSEVTEATGLYDDLGLDSVRAFEALVILESWAELLFTPDFVPELYTLGDAYRYFLQCRNAAGEQWGR
jgi:acyl carrier protein